MNKEYLDEMYVKLKNKEEYKFFLDRLEHSIIIIDKNQIEFINSKFLRQFQYLIEYYDNNRIRDPEIPLST